MDDIGGVNIGHKESSYLSPAVEVAAEGVNQTDTHADTEKRFPEGINQRLPMPATSKGDISPDGPDRHHHGGPQKDHQDSHSQPEAARFIGQGGQPVTPVGDQPDDEKGDVLGEEGKLQVQWLKGVNVHSEG